MSVYDRAGVNNGQTAGGPLFGQGQRFSADSAAAERLRLEALEIAQRFQFGTQEPTTRADGSALQEGDVYIHTVAGMEGIFLYDVDTSTYIDVIGLSSRDPRLAIQETAPTENLLEGYIWIDTSGTGLPVINLYDGSQFQVVAPTAQEIIDTVNAYTGTTLIQAAHTEATVTNANTGGTATVVLDTVEISGITYRVGGSTPAHARLRTSLTLSQNSIQLPRLGTVIITGTVSASIESPIAGDVINDVIIRSVHSSYADDRTGTPTVVSDTESRFAWNFQVGDPAQVVTFTVSYSVNGVIDGQIERSNHTETINLTIIAEPQHYWAGAVNQSNLDALTVSLADNQINSISGLTRRDNFTSPATIEYNGGGAGATPSLYAVIVVDQSINITSLNSDGFPTTISSFNDSTTGRTIYTTEAFLSEGTHSLTWRT